MRTYHNNSNDKKRRIDRKKLTYSLLLAFSVIAVAVIITLSLTLGRPAPAIETPAPPPDPIVDVDVPPVEDPKPAFVMPMENFTVGKPASLDRLVYSSSMKYWKTHNGIDFLAEAGTTVFAVSAGTVTAVQNTVLEAMVITIDHGNGLFSYYKGLNETVAVNVGDAVEAGAAIGTVAANMPLERDEGPHLHLEMKQDGKFVDPADYLPAFAEK
ncbi:MAG: peptidoglycan DD-metalloendopeptidase family protein [Clostridiales bacterium]|jgi:murein DD-endopeptidase MepM/ murein hydrolase activator NlpD|nr:peptidoglycan DD-metalloendopeptidase family protein [Clostridiales bacterium]